MTFQLQLASLSCSCHSSGKAWQNRGWLERVDWSVAGALAQRLGAVFGVFGGVVYVLPFGVSRHSFELLLSDLYGVHVVSFPFVLCLGSTFHDDRAFFSPC